MSLTIQIMDLEVEKNSDYITIEDSFKLDSAGYLLDLQCRTKRNHPLGYQ